MTLKRILAIIALCGWAVLIILTLVFAFINTDSARNVLKALIGADIALPVFIWICMMIYKNISRKK